MKRFDLGLSVATKASSARKLREIIAGLLVAAAVFFVLPTNDVRAQQPTSRSRTVNESQGAQATIILNEGFLNGFLDAMFTHLRPPTFPLSLAQLEARPDLPAILSAHSGSAGTAQCASEIVLEREKDGVRTSVRLENGRIVAQLAFSGTYSAGLFGCLSFEGWANSNVTLEFDRERQAILARVTIQNVQLSGLPALANNIVVSMVQTSVDRRFNPYELFKSEQLSPTLPIKAAGGALRLRAIDMRPEIMPGALRITIAYQFERAG